MLTLQLPDVSMSISNNPMYILNDTAKNDPAVQIALQAYTERLAKEEQYRQRLVTSYPTTSWNISDRD